MTFFNKLDRSTLTRRRIPERTCFIRGSVYTGIAAAGSVSSVHTHMGVDRSFPRSIFSPANSCNSPLSSPSPAS